MLDDFRDNDDSSLFDFEDDFEEEVPGFEEDSPPVAPPKPVYDPNMFGMTPVQRFTLALLFFILVCMMSVMFLVVTGRIAIL